MKALVVVDYQTDFVCGALGFAGAERLEPIILRKISNTRSSGGQVIFTLDTHGADYLDTAEGRRLPVPHCITPHGQSLYGRTAASVRAEDIVIRKSAFGSLELADLLKGCGFEETELCGVTADMCVLSNAVIARAALPESRVVVDSSAVASADTTACERALLVMQGLHIDVI